MRPRPVGQENPGGRGIVPLTHDYVYEAALKTVFILGAGASVGAGAPLMADFLQKAKQLNSLGAFGATAPQIQDVLDAAYKDLRPVHVKSKIDYQNIEELFSAVDIGQLIHSFGSRSPEMIDELRRSIVTFIYRTIEQTVEIPFRNGKIGLPNGYDMLSKHVRKKIDQTARLGLSEVSFITFNYDTCLEFSLVRNGIGVDYGLGEPFLNEAENNFQIKVPVLKLHGSINWGTCPKCKMLVPSEIDPFRRVGLTDLLDEGQVLRLNLGSGISGQVHSCRTVLDPLPFIVPPTWNKSSSALGLRDVWKRAAVELGSAENIVVIGYSHPPTDMFFKYLYALGSNTDTHLEKFIVINGPDSSGTKERFEGLLGPTTSRGFEFNQLLFSGAENIIKRVLET
jgi:hypothetical protein